MICWRFHRWFCLTVDANRFIFFSLSLKWKDFNFLHFLFYIMFNVERQKKIIQTPKNLYKCRWTNCHRSFWIGISNKSDSISVMRLSHGHKSSSSIYSAHKVFASLNFHTTITERWWRPRKRFTKNIFNHFSKQLKWELFWYCSALRLVFTFCSRRVVHNYQIWTRIAEKMENHRMEKYNHLKNVETTKKNEFQHRPPNKRSKNSVIS